MARLALGVVGGVIGAYFGGPAGASIGFSLGSLVGGLVDPEEGPTTQGPRLQDLTVQSSAEGVGIPIVFGRARIAGNVIWAQPIKETRLEEETGGGKGGMMGGGGGTQVSYTYSVSFAIGICEGPITGIRKIWADSKLFFDTSASVNAETLLVSSERAESIRVYPGSETQSADPTIQSFEGAANTPAYRGLAYIVFEDLGLADFANRMPNITVEMVASGQAAPALIDEIATPPCVTEWSSSSLMTADANGAAFLCVGEADGAYNSAWVQVWVLYPDGTLIKGIRFSTATNNPIAQGFTDEPAFIHNNFATGGYVYYYRIGDNGNSATLTATIRLPAGVQANFSNAGSVCARAGQLYLLSWWTPVVMRASADGGPSEIAEVVFSAAAAAALPALLHDIFVGSTKIFGILNNNTLRVWDLEFNFLQSIAFSPPANTIGYSHFGGTETLIRASDDRFVYLLYGPTTVRHIHRIDLAAGTYAYLGAVTVTGIWYECFGGAAVRGDLLNIYSSIANRLQQINLAALTPSAPTLASVVSALCLRTGLAAGDLDTAALTDAVDGYVIPRPMTARAALEQLRQAYFFDGVEADGKIKYIKRGGASQATIAADDLGAREYGGDPQEPIRITRSQELELPAEVHVQYIDIDNDYLPGSQEARRLTTSSRNQIRIDLPIALSSAKAAQVADVLMRNAWVERHRFAFALTRKYARLDPADNISVPTVQGLALARLVRTDYGASGVLACEALADDTVLYTSSVAGNDASVNEPQTLSLAGPTQAVLLDTAGLRDADDDPGFYIACSGYLSGWKGAVIYKSVDSGATWDAAMGLLSAARLGYATGVLGGFTGGNVWDLGSRINVKLITPGGTLSSSTELAVYAGANAAALGAHGRWEIIQFRTATLEVDGTYTLSDLLRGRRGTEWAQGLHLANDIFVALTSATLRRLEAASSEIGLARLYRAVSIGGSLEGAETKSFTNAAAGLECYAPCNIGGGRNAAGDIIINWERRTRTGGEWRDYVDVSLSETTENYECEIWNTAFTILKRTITGLTAKTTTYVSASQVTDFGSNQSSIGVKLYQVSATVARGYPGQALV